MPNCDKVRPMDDVLLSWKKLPFTIPGGNHTRKSAKWPNDPRNGRCTGPPGSGSARRNSRPSAPAWEAGGCKTPPVPSPGDNAWPGKGPASGRTVGYSALPSGPALKSPPSGRHRLPVFPQRSTHQGCHFFLDADHQLRLAELLPQPGVLTRKTTEHPGADGALGHLAVPGKLPPPFRQLGAVDPLPKQDLVDLAAGGPGLVHLREDPQLVRVTDGPPRRPDQYLGIPFDAVLIAFGNDLTPALKPFNHR